MKLEKHKNLWEESRFYWGEIEDGTLTFDRPQVEVCFDFNVLRSWNSLLLFVRQRILFASLKALSRWSDF